MIAIQSALPTEEDEKKLDKIMGYVFPWVPHDPVELLCVSGESALDAHHGVDVRRSCLTLFAK